MTATTPGREVVQIVEIQQPYCSRNFGISPCLATGTSDQKCYNTRSTCKYTAAFQLRSTPLSLFFSRGNVAERGVSGATYIIPSLVSVSTSPTKINFAGANPDAQGLGNRALCTIVLQDHQHTDQIVDPYLSGRSWDPLSRDRGTFWTRWLIRNKYRQNIVIRVYEGYSGQSLSAMTRRTYFLQSISGPNNGRVTIQAKDVLAKIEERKAQAPVASPGELYAPISASDTLIQIAGASLSDYASSGIVRIGDELISYSSTSSSSSGITLNGTTRGAKNSIVSQHAAGDSVQQCLQYTNARIDDVIADLLVNYGGIDVDYLDAAGWVSEINLYATSYLLSTIITEPTSVAQLVSEIQEQALVYIWWDERTAKIKLRVIRGIDSTPPTISDTSNIIADSVSFSEMPRQRASQVWIWYDRSDFVKSPTDQKSYSSLIVNANLESETDNLYGEKSIRKIFGRWLGIGALAQTTASKIIRRYVEVPTEIKFRLDAKDRSYWVGDVVAISHYLDVDSYGNRRVRYWLIVSAEEVVPGEVVEYVAEDTTLFGRIYYIGMSSRIGDANGLLLNGQESAKIS